MTTGKDKTAGGNGNGHSGKDERGLEIKDSLRAPLPKRFYKSVAVVPRDEGFAITLDGRAVRTPGKREMVVPVEALAEAIAEEWTRQGERIDPATMPLTRLANSAIEGVSERMREVRDDVVAFAGSDLICYRAQSPAALVARQQAAWDPVLAWAKDTLSADFKLQEGVMPIEQAPEALQAIANALAGLDALSLSAVHVLTTISGSAILAIAHLNGRLSVEEAWSAATVDEVWQSEQWGRDAEAEAHATRRLAEFKAASRCLLLLHLPR
jgi:chaperone required for assembly of F1-ATPase